MSSADKSDESDPTNNDATGDEWCAPTLNKTISQEQLDLFVRKLGLSKADAVLTGSMLREYGVLDIATQTSVYKTRDKEFVEFFKQDDAHDFAYCHDIQ